MSRNTKYFICLYFAGGDTILIRTQYFVAYTTMNIYKYRAARIASTTLSWQLSHEYLHPWESGIRQLVNSKYHGPLAGADADFGGGSLYPNILRHEPQPSNYPDLTSPTYFL